MLAFIQHYPLIAAILGLGSLLVIGLLANVIICLSKGTSKVDPLQRYFNEFD